MCEENLHELNKLKDDFEPVKIRYEQARDFHKAIKGRLRRDYYHFLKLASLPIDPNMGIEAKAASLKNLQLSDEYLAERKRIAGVLEELEEAKATEQKACEEYCVAHNDLRKFIVKTKKSAKDCYRLAMLTLRRNR